MSTPSDPTSAQVAFDRLLTNHVSPLFKLHGYKKSALNWRRRHDAGPGPRGWSLMNLQKSQWNNRDQISFTFNVGVLWDDMPPHVPMSKQGPSHLACHRSSRLGELAPAGRDEWCQIEYGRWSPGEGPDPDPVDRVVATLLPMLEDHALPWLDRHFADGVELAKYRRDVEAIHARERNARRES